MPSYLDLLPADIIAHVFRMLYKSIIIDMKKDSKYKNITWFDKLQEITKNPYIDNLHYYDFVKRSYGDNIIDKYRDYEIYNDTDQFLNLSLYNSSLYYKSYYIKPLEFCINKIEIFNYFIYDSFKNDDEGLILFNNTYFACINNTGVKKNANKNGFILEREGPFRCLAEILYYIIDFYDFLKQIIYMNIEFIEQLGNIFNLSSKHTRDSMFLINILNFHNNHRYIENLIYDIDNKCVITYLE